MSFIEGRYIALNGTWLPTKFISPESFTAYPELIVKKTWRDGNGMQHKKYYPNAELVVSFATSELDDDLTDELFGLINTKLSATRTCSITAYCRDTDSYKTQVCVVDPIVPVLYRHGGSRGNVWKEFSISARGLGGAIT